MRFIAIFVVLFCHYLPQYQLIGSIDMGALIVFFFVLSSYLITTILLVSRQKGKEMGYSKSKIALGFLVRRSLRIFPAYYVYILLLFFLPLNVPELKENFLVYALYISNFYIYLTQEWHGLTSHIWTLAVEEQFYLLWPWLMLFVPERHLPKVFFGAIALGITSRLALFYALPYINYDAVQIGVLTPTCLDGFGFGGLLAYLHLRGHVVNGWILKSLLLLAPLWLIGIYFDLADVTAVLNRVMVSLGALAVLQKAFTGFTGITGKMLENKVVLYLAKISYGIYIYHMLAATSCWILFWQLITRFKILIHDVFTVDLSPLVNLLLHPVSIFITNALISVLLATLSWYLIERPCNSLKRYFSFRKNPAPSPAAVLPELVAQGAAPAGAKT